MKLKDHSKKENQVQGRINWCDQIRSTCKQNDT